MNNPLNSDPRYALFPAPTGSTGYRIWEMLHSKDPSIFRKDYIDGFERVNLVDDRVWNSFVAESNASRLPSRYAGRTIVVFGEECRRAIGLPKMLIHPVEQHGVTWRQLPHPSGRNLWFNDPECYDLAASLLHELYLKGKE